MEVIADVAHCTRGKVSGGRAVLELELLVPRWVRSGGRGRADAGALKRTGKQ